MQQARRNAERDSNGSVSRFRSKVDRETECVQGKVESVEKVNDSKVEIEVSYDGDGFKQQFTISSSTDLNGNTLYRLLDYKGIRDGRFLELRGKKVPIDVKGYRQRIVVPKRKTTLSDIVFKTLQKLRKYKIIRSRLSKNNYQMTYIGYLLFTGILSPLLFMISDIFDITSSVVSQLPFISASSHIFAGLSVLSTIAAASTTVIFGILSIGFSLMILLYGATKSCDYVKSKFWPF